MNRKCCGESGATRPLDGHLPFAAADVARAQQMAKHTTYFATRYICSMCSSAVTRLAARRAQEAVRQDPLEAVGGDSLRRIFSFLAPSSLLQAALVAGARGRRTSVGTLLCGEAAASGCGGSKLSLRVPVPVCLASCTSGSSLSHPPRPPHLPHAAEELCAFRWSFHFKEAAGKD
jgi:hypothetical protein